ncbi:hypothetical protein GCM10025768_19170 [Microbacterium pseudoresistens]|uniref:Ubiquinone/menaquinone biosynthesis C-methylase UbiE n=1 Tax=Microbacterium pseudoresistens TaxID=640634 RepID=A0A7Y9JNZ4_9MICO|nr:methyltransferase domain-containing protein [Microbacterium pseudoresistens]NYD55611.1 ubiquinone/menaquinone biosynthesis C-methylase UbiE [Microbacterium pseudoresistens]
MDDVEKVIAGVFDERADSYDDKPFHHDLTTAIAEFIDLSAVSRVVDLATGTGLMLRALDARTPGLALTGVDISERMLAIAAHALPHASWVLASAASTGLPDASTDLVTCVTALHLMPDKDGVLGECRRLLAPNGRLVTATFSEGGRRPSPSRYLGSAVDHDSFSTQEALRQTMGASGFALARHQRWEDATHIMGLAEFLPH